MLKTQKLKAVFRIRVTFIRIRIRPKKKIRIQSGSGSNPDPDPSNYILIAEFFFRFRVTFESCNSGWKEKEEKRTFFSQIQHTFSRFRCCTHLSWAIKQSSFSIAVFLPFYRCTFSHFFIFFHLKLNISWPILD